MKFLSSKGIHLTQPQLVVTAFGLILAAALIAMPAILILRGQARVSDANPADWPTLDAGIAQATGQPTGVLGAASSAAATAAAPATTPTLVLGSTGSAPPQAPQTYIVQDGDTLSGIAVQHGVTLEALLAANGFTYESVIVPGQQITIPAGSVIPTQAPNPTSQATNPTAQLPADTPRAAEGDNPLAPWSIDALTSYPYDGGAISKDAFWTRTAAYEVWSVSYLSDGLRVTGLVHIPTQGEGPFPVVILLHGGIDQSAYEQGDDTAIHAEYFARNGYLTFAPDYRSYNDTEGSGSPLKLPWVIDSMNAINALPTLPEADPTRIGVFGHSRGGGIAGYLMVLSPQVDATILYAPLHTDQAVVWDIYANTFGAEWPGEDAAIWGSPRSNPEGYRMISPYYTLDRVRAPVQIHHGAWDSVLPIAWSEDLYAQLMGLGKTVEYYAYPEGAHTLTGGDWELMMERSLGFFDTWVK